MKSPKLRIGKLKPVLIGGAIACGATLLTGHGRLTKAAMAEALQVSRAERTSTGFYYPTGAKIDANSDRMTGWKERDKEHGGRYEKGKYHIGKDIPARGPSPSGPGAEVYAIADGEVAFILTTDAKDFSYFGEGNSAVFIRHTLADGRRFLSFYLHVRPSVRSKDPAGKPVPIVAGQKIANIGPWYEGPHLHFGVAPGWEIPKTDKQTGRGWGRMANANWPDTNGFTDPIEWIENPKNVPKGRKPNGAGELDFKNEWTHVHPARYAGPVWIKVSPAPGNANRSHRITVRWGPWEYTRSTVFGLDRAIYFTHKKSDDGIAQPLTVSVEPAASISFGRGVPKGGGMVDINEGWIRVD